MQMSLFFPLIHNLYSKTFAYCFLAKPERVLICDKMLTLLSLLCAYSR